MTTSDSITVTEADLLKFAPKAKREYLTAILGKLSVLQRAGVLESSHRWCHFMGQVGHETDGLTIIRESLHYTTAKRIKEVWPARFKDWKDEDIQKKLCKNPVALGDAVYGGRMGNKVPGDGCAYRGGGFLQTTGRDAVVEYAGNLGLDPTPALLDDLPMTLEFAVIEWAQSGCNEHADENDLLAVSKAINTGAATSGVRPVGMDGRKEWFARAWAVWGDKGKADKPAKKPVDAKKIVTISTGGALAVTETAKALKDVAAGGVPSVPDVATKSLENATAWKAIGKSVYGLGIEVASLPWGFLAVAGVAASVLAFLKLKERGNVQAD